MANEVVVPQTTFEFLRCEDCEETEETSFSTIERRDLVASSSARLCHPVAKDEVVPQSTFEVLRCEETEETSPA